LASTRLLARRVGSVGTEQRCHDSVGIGLVAHREHVPDPQAVVRAVRLVALDMAKTSTRPAPWSIAASCAISAMVGRGTSTAERSCWLLGLAYRSLTIARSLPIAPRISERNQPGATIGSDAGIHWGQARWPSGVGSWPG
jgi:hypothetical protein